MQDQRGYQEVGLKLTWQGVGDIETKLGKLVKELNYGGDILDGLTRMDTSLSNLIEKEELSLYSCFTK